MTPAQKRADEKMRLKRFRKTLAINPDTEPVLFRKAVELENQGKLTAVLKKAILESGNE